MRRALVAGALMLTIDGNWVGSGEATPMVLLSSGPSSIAIEDNDMGDLNPMSGAITYSGAFGSFVVTVSTGVSVPVLGTVDSPHLDLNSIDVTGLTAGSLTIKLTDTGFAGSPAGKPFSSTIGGVAGGTVSLSTYVDSSNIPFGTASLLGVATYGPGVLGGNMVGVGAGGGASYSLTEVVTLTLPALAGSSFNAELQALPEPASLLLFGTGLVGLGLLSRRRRRHAKGAGALDGRQPAARDDDARA